eukprot:TRINITY_DN10558_c0_g1_i1.p1 TRINITY_DN10558_c0_g1~~TRINITY_DN10558_c0_g1_i1.p1  ORF type:complete len:498 (-),score=103.45 TRINITY_DN10558_c0_g1_i1:9-1466(-)
MRIAVVGSGVSGLSCSWMLSNNLDHKVVLYESGDYLGGHTNTVDVKAPDGKTIAVDTGFIVYNELNYPNLVAMFRELGVETIDSDMSFALSVNRLGESRPYEWAGDNLRTVFPDVSYLFSPFHWRMLWGIMRFNRESLEILTREGDDDITTQQWLDEHGFSAEFTNNYLLPITASVWSVTMKKALEFPFKSLIQFMHNHRLLQTFNRPQWKTVQGGSREYVKKIKERLNQNKVDIRLKTPVKSLHRIPKNGKDVVSICDVNGKVEEFDHVVLACHADTALKMIQDPTAYEKRVLGVFKYSKNTAHLHSDISLLPMRSHLWSAWNFMRPDAKTYDLVLSYWMNRLQTFLPKDFPLIVTLNPHQQIPKDKLHKVIEYEHPIYVPQVVPAQKEIQKTNGSGTVSLIGAYTGFGFHEDGLLSGLRTARALGGKCLWNIDESRYETANHGKQNGFKTSEAPIGVSSLFTLDWIVMMLCFGCAFVAIKYFQ